MIKNTLLLASLCCISILSAGKRKTVSTPVNDAEIAACRLHFDHIVSDIDYRNLTCNDWVDEPLICVGIDPFFSCFQQDLETTKAIHKAAAQGDLDHLARLKETGADMHARNRTGVHALHLAAYCGQASIIEAFCKERDQLLSEAEELCLTINGQTLLHVAVQGYCNTMSACDDQQASQKIKNALKEQYKTIIQLLTSDHTKAKTTGKSLDVTGYLLNPSMKDQSGNTASNIARQNGHNDIAELAANPSCGHYAWRQRDGGVEYPLFKKASTERSCIIS